MAVKEADVRKALYRDLLRPDCEDENAVVLNELGLCEGRARIDVAALNGELVGYEIKSERDTLDRLPRQIKYYDRVFDRLLLVTSECHLKGGIDFLPEHWGLVTTRPEDDSVHLSTAREAEPNPNIDPYALSQLLWKPEVLSILENNDLDWGVRSKPRSAMWERLAENFSAREITRFVLKAWKNREGWPVDQQPS